MSIYRIFGDASSGNCLKVKWTADYLGLAYDWIETSVVKRETRRPEFLSLNPAGQIPLIILPDGRRLAQSNAIITYLAAIEKSDLLPADPFERAKVDEWMFWEQYSHEPYIAVRRFHKTLLGKRDDEIDPRLLENGARALSLMESQLSETPYMAGERVTLADVALVAYTRFADEAGFDLDEYPTVKGWVARIERDLAIAPREAA